MRFRLRKSNTYIYICPNKQKNLEKTKKTKHKKKVKPKAPTTRFF